MAKKTYEQRVEEYLKWSKESLARALANRDIEEELRRGPQDSDFEPCKPYTAEEPKCKTFIDCTNPYRDCINCPLRFTTGGGGFTLGGYVHTTKSNEVNY